MVLKFIRISGLASLISLSFLTSCEDTLLVNCDECQLVEPVSALLSIQLGETISSNISYDVTIYRGKIDDGIIIYNATAFTTSFSYSVRLNSEYTVTASSVIKGIEYIAVDATRPRVEIITETCGETCYLVVNNTVNLKIKYY
ncbi:MAG: hypothetical protein KFF49_07870 [Bacteroidales bacterium]|nr:hypothetical protein [Bacteroidales bacterium]